MFVLAENLKIVFGKDFNRANRLQMKKIKLYIFLVLFFFTTGLYAYDGKSQFETFILDGIPHVISDTLWRVDMHGTHRAVVRVSNSEDTDAVKVILPWRRTDFEPEKKKVVVVDAQTGQDIKNVKILSLTAENGTVAFEPTSGDGIYCAK